MVQSFALSPSSLSSLHSHSSSPSNPPNSKNGVKMLIAGQARRGTTVQVGGIFSGERSGGDSLGRKEGRDAAREGGRGGRAVGGRGNDDVYARFPHGGQALSPPLPYCLTLSAPQPSASRVTHIRRQPASRSFNFVIPKSFLNYEGSHAHAELSTKCWLHIFAFCVIRP